MTLKSLLEAATQQLDDASRALEEQSRKMSMDRAVKKALSACDLAFYAEKVAITQAIEGALREVEIDEKCARDAEFAKLYRAEFARLSAAIPRSRGRSRLKPTFTLRKFVRPVPQAEREVDEAIQREFRILAEERARFFESARVRLQRDPRLREKVKALLEKWGRGAYWEAIS